ncbi:MULTISPECIES: DUF6944 family repetitive protein [Bacillus]|uniref:DUF6944 family repetitive protein n=1 Tax=Bacillus TaxID=1386 RepID=UPI0002D61D56|nr:MULTISPECIES: hypothetical protein [Bacillus]
MNLYDYQFYSDYNSQRSRTYHYNQIANNTEMTIAQWVEAFGTVLSAIGNTPIEFLSSDFLYDINLVGDVLQVSATSVQLDAETKLTYNSLGNMLQIVGNSEEIAGYILFKNDQTVQNILVNQGNAIQVVGIGSSLVFFLAHKRNLVNIYNIYANLIQMIGLSIQMLSTISTLTKEQSQTLNVVGNWTQAIGAILAAIAQSLD